ncbi:hypothetical protein RJT34_21652 [Clitoria ternatea]|uniref:Uncharacterized protein n=1 Tax=Clitoria ternatea TaxID=43366 RepID=A0AAN9IUH5_CLITE
METINQLRACLAQPLNLRSPTFRHVQRDPSPSTRVWLRRRAPFRRGERQRAPLARGSFDQLRSNANAVRWEKVESTPPNGVTPFSDLKL